MTMFYIILLIVLGLLFLVAELVLVFRLAAAEAALGVVLHRMRGRGS